MKHEPGHAYESEIDALMRKMRQEPAIEAERQRNWRYWWQANPAQRDSANVSDGSENPRNRARYGLCQPP